MKKIKTYIIYRVVNIENNKIYIGQTSDRLNKRKNAHINSSLTKNKTYYFNLAILKYGVESFIFEEIDRCFNPKVADALEIHYIKYYKSQDRNFGYNLTKGGCGENGRNFNHTKQHKHVKSIFFRELWKTEEYRNKVLKSREIFYKNNIDPKSKKVICIETGIIYPSISRAVKETGIKGIGNVLRKIAITAEGLHWAYFDENFNLENSRKNLVYNNCNKKSIICIENGKEYSSIMEASHNLNITHSNISSVLRGITKQANGFHFEYKV